MGAELTVDNIGVNNQSVPVPTYQQPSLSLPSYLPTERKSQPVLDQSNPIRKWLAVEDGIREPQLNEIREEASKNLETFIEKATALLSNDPRPGGQDSLRL